MNTDLVSQFRNALSNIKGWAHYNLLKQRAQILTQEQQLQVVDSFIAARLQLEGGAL